MYHTNELNRNSTLIQDSPAARNTVITIPVLTRRFGSSIKKPMTKMVLAGLILTLTGCAGLAQTGSITKAYETYEHGHYAKTLKLITQAENFSTVSPEFKAELTYLRAQTYRKLSQTENAYTLFEYLKDQHTDSQYGYLAAKHLEQR